MIPVIAECKGENSGNKSENNCKKSIEKARIFPK